MDEIENEEHEILVASASHRVLELWKLETPSGASPRSPVQHRALRGEPGRGGGDHLETLRPVQAVPGQEARASPVTRQRKRYPSYLISWSQPSPSGASETSVASCGGIHRGRAARRAPGSAPGSAEALLRAFFRRSDCGARSEFQVFAQHPRLVRPLKTLSGRSTRMSLRLVLAPGRAP